MEPETIDEEQKAELIFYENGALRCIRRDRINRRRRNVQVEETSTAPIDNSMAPRFQFI